MNNFIVARIPIRHFRHTAANSDRLANPGGTGETWIMDRRMSDNELRRAIRVLRDRADDARSHGRPEDADGIERTIRDYQDEMAQRL